MQQAEWKEEERFQWIQDRFNRLSAHRYLNQHVSKVSIDRDKMMLFTNCIDAPELAEEGKLKRTTAAMLVDAALTTHQYVPLHNEARDREIEKQLTVLAGDWFSSLYYSELAKLEDVKLVRVFSGSIQKTNDAKIRLHEHDWSGVDELESLVTIMESTLIKNVGVFYNHEAVQHLAPPFLTYRRLLDMIEHAEEKENPFGSARLSPLFAMEPVGKLGMYRQKDDPATSNCR